MKTRIISGLLMLPFAIVVFWGGKVLMLGCFAIGIMSVREFFNGFGAMGIRPAYKIAYVSTLALYGINLFTTEPRWYMLWFFGVVLASLLYLFKMEERKLEDGMATITGIFYTVFFSFHVTLVEQTGEYGLLVWLIFLTAFGTDIMAYFTGYFLGKHKLCPTISPKKTIEGSVGGILGSVILCGLFGYFLIPRLLMHCIILGILGGVVSQFGDLTASIFKRKMGIKDYGNLIPGHGGILDRFDSVLFTAPMVYYYIALVL
ncbi:phosphatidate cytidylyltransferase [Aminipila luticellarii]|uniref:Phosphatidate cytidylyltransferase n=1 Tax=Aminipila luticellarii TaxID=2507160 RepID=A0A410PW30_9FIRM|nr:phosphatidate cytidylyltransferase [Aminipila luticellarii]QAT43137.1 phosphatidate cytidylyltransferase [Aminipila luticellarii]